MGFPPSFYRLFQHPAIVWLNVGIAEEDLKSLSDSFFQGNMSGVVYIDTRDLVVDAFGGSLPRHDDVSGVGVLGSF